MKEQETIIQKIRCFYYSVALPVCLVENDLVIYSLPDQIPSFASVTDLDFEFPPVSSEEQEVQYLKTEYGENYIAMNCSDNLYVLVGPFVTESPSAEFISDFFRSGNLKLKFRNAIEQYYASLPLISSQKYYYCGKLLEKLLQQPTQTIENDIAEYSTQFNKSDYYWKSHDYRKQQFLHSPYPTEQEILRAISKGNKKAALHILKEINMRPRARLAGTVLRSLKNSLIGSCTIMSRAAIQGGVDPDTAFTLSDTFIQDIEKTTDTNTLLNIESEMVSRFADAVNELRNRKYSRSVSQAINYIESHLCDAISVEDIAKASYMSPNYLSAVFAKETGETIHNRILRRRIEESSFFVGSSSSTFAEIASFYQFCSQSHFIQCFKKFMGVTPGEFRNGNVNPKE